MALIRETERNYGADADGKRGIDISYCYVESDISGQELDEDELYFYDGQVMSYDELLKLDNFENGYSKILDEYFDDYEDYEARLWEECHVTFDEYLEIER